MAVSGENRLRSVQGYAIPSVVGPRPSQPIEAGHLAQIAWLYSGLTFAAAATGGGPAAAVGGLLPVWTRRRRG